MWGDELGIGSFQKPTTGLPTMIIMGITTLKLVLHSGNFGSNRKVTYFEAF
jgi:hypothetical protein